MVLRARTREQGAREQGARKHGPPSVASIELVALASVVLFFKEAALAAAVCCWRLALPDPFGGISPCFYYLAARKSSDFQ